MYIYRIECRTTSNCHQFRLCVHYFKTLQAQLGPAGQISDVHVADADLERTELLFFSSKQQYLIKNLCNEVFIFH